MKKIIAIMMAVMMLIGAMACAQAASSPTTGAVSSPTTGGTSSPSVKPGTSSPSVKPGHPGGAPKPEVISVVDADEELMNAIMDFAKSGAVIEYFGQDAIAKALALLPDDVDIMSAQLDELFAVECKGYNPKMGDLDITFTCVTTYEQDDVMLAMIGVEKDGATAWTPLKAVVDDQGCVVVTFTQEVLEAINGTVSPMALLRME